MNKSIKDILSKIEQSNGLRIGIAFVIIIVLVVYFLPEQKKQDELARLAKKGDWKELIEKSSDYLKKEQTPKAFYYKAKGYFQLFKKESSREKEVEQLTHMFNVLSEAKRLFDSKYQTEYQFAMQRMVDAGETYYNYLQLKGDTSSSNVLVQAGSTLFEIYSETPLEMVKGNVVKTCYKLLNSPYRAGGVSPSKGFDCSGFTHFVFKQEGLQLPHGAYLQAKKGLEIDEKEVEAGDLIFFGEDTLVDHVGIIVGSDLNGLVMIHASNSGVEELNKTSESWKNYWSTKSYFFRRLLVD